MASKDPTRLPRTVIKALMALVAASIFASYLIGVDRNRSGGDPALSPMFLAIGTFSLYGGWLCWARPKVLRALHARRWWGPDRIPGIPYRLRAVFLLGLGSFCVLLGLGGLIELASRG